MDALRTCIITRGNLWPKSVFQHISHGAILRLHRNGHLFLVRPKLIYSNFISKFRKGHETAGTVMAVGKNVRNVVIGNRVAADPLQPCLNCFHCTRRKPLLCENLIGFGGNAPGGCAQYCRYPARQIHPIGDLPALEAVLVEPAACATHGIERMQIEVGSRVLLFGCGPTGIMLAQLIRMNGAAHVRW